MPRVTGTTVPCVVSVSAKMKSLQANRNANSPTVINEFRLIGTTTDTSDRTRPAPSTRAASTIEGGTPSMNERRIRMPNGIALAALATMRPGTELSRPSRSYSV